MEFAATLSRKAGEKPTDMNLGGGMGIAYKDGDSEFDLKKFGEGLRQLDKRIKGIRELKDAVFHIEPGRFLMGPAGVYVLKVVALKNINGRRYVMTDGGIHHALFPFRVSREFPVKILNRKEKESEKKLRYILGGALCTSLDQSDLPVKLPRLAVGDFLGIYQSGCYGFSSGMHFFLSHPLPAELLKNGDRLSVIRRPSMSEHLFRNQTDKTIAIIV